MYVNMRSCAVAWSIFTLHVHTVFLSCSFASSEAGWLLASCPSELLGALEEHVDILTHQLGSEVVTSDLMGTKEGSVALQVVSHCADFSMATARLAV